MKALWQVQTLSIIRNIIHVAWLHNGKQKL